MYYALFFLGTSKYNVSDCWFSIAGEVKLIPKPGAVCFVNGRKIDSPTALRTGSRVILGKNHVFRFNHPEQGKGQPHSFIDKLRF